MLHKIAVVVISLIFASAAQRAELLGAGVALEKTKDGSIFLIDIRRPEEWKASGLAEPAHAISMHQEGFLEKLNKLVHGKKDASIALICATGARSTWLSAELEKRGYSNILNVREGMMGSQSGPGWIRRNLPVRPFEAQ